MRECRKVMEKAVSDRMKSLRIKRRGCVCLRSGQHSAAVGVSDEKKKGKTGSQ